MDSDSLVGVVIESIIDRLDPHSTFIPKTASQELAENMQGEFVGIGVSFYGRRHRSSGSCTQRWS